MNENGNAKNIDRETAALSAMIKDVPDLDPPEDILAGVMARIEPKKRPWHRKILSWLTTPRTITLSPALIIPAVAAAVLVLALVPMLMAPSGQPPVAVNTSNIRAAALTSGGQVAFSLPMDDASSVALVGSFNDWNPEGFEMRKDPELGQWRIVTNIPAGRHQYGFLVNGETLVPDPGALMNEPDGFGGVNSILIMNNGGGNVRTI